MERPGGDSGEKGRTRMRKKLLGALLALLAGATAGLVALPDRSYASTGFTTTGGGYVSSNNLWESTLLGSDWRVGDCTMLGNYSSTGSPFDARTYARIVQPDSSG